MLNLIEYPQRYVILKLPTGSQIPKSIYQSLFLSVSKSDSELSLIFDQALLEKSFDQTYLSKDWRLFKLSSSFDFDETGVLLKLIKPLSEASIGIMAISSFDTDYLLVQAKDLIRSKKVLQKNYFVQSQNTMQKTI